MGNLFVRAALLVLSFSLIAEAFADGTEYVAKSALAKRAWHREMAGATNQANHLPGLVEVTCKQTLALAGFAFPSYLQKTMSSPSGYPTDLWRRLFGKAIHSRGVTSPGTIVIPDDVGGLKAGTYPVTYRFSLANPYIPLIPMAEFRPGLLIMFHRDGEDDLNLLLMPRAGLRGFHFPINPFSISYTHWLDEPGLALRLIAKLTFGRVSQDIYSQFTDDDLRLNFKPSQTNLPSRETRRAFSFRPYPEWQTAYDRTTAFDFRKRFAEMTVGKHSPLFLMSINDQKVGEAFIDDSWISSKHGDTWIAQHRGFILD
jgi:hypothetical protein